MKEASYKVTYSCKMLSVDDLHGILSTDWDTIERSCLKKKPQLHDLQLGFSSKSYVNLFSNFSAVPNFKTEYRRPKFPV